MEQNNKTLSVVGLIVVIILLAFFGYRFLWQSPAVENQGDDATLQAELDKANPFNQEEPANPFEESSNPYENIKTNPFE